MTTGSINHLRMSVRDIAATDAFYDPLLRHLSFTKERREDGGVAWLQTDYSCGKQWLIFCPTPDAFRDMPLAEADAPGFQHLALNASSRYLVDKVHTLIAARSLEVLKPPQEYDYEPGYYAVFFRDPDGNKVEVVHSPDSSGTPARKAPGAGL
jgi:glyoxylase I family protein